MFAMLASALRSAVASGAKVLPRRLAGRVAQGMAAAEARSAASLTLGHESYEEYVARIEGAANAPSPGPQPRGVDVLENTTIGNAKALQQSLAGQAAESTPPTPTPPAGVGQPPPTTPPSPPTGAGAGQPSSSPSPSPSPGVGGAGNPPQTPRAPAGGADWWQPPDDNSKDNTPFPHAGTHANTVLDTPDAKSYEAAGGNWLNRLADRFDQWRQKRQQFAADQIPIAQQVAGMTYEQRHERLEKANALLPPEQVGRALGTPVPNLQQIVEQSEKRQEESRQDRQRQLAEDVPHDMPSAAKFAFKNTIIGGANILGVLAGASKLMEMFSERVSESNRGLSKFNGTLAASFAAKDIASMRSDWRTAQGTQGTAGMLNLELAKVIEEIQPIRQQIATALNFLGIIAAKAAATNASMLKNVSSLAGIKAVLDWIEEKARKDLEKRNILHNTPVHDMLRDIRDGKFSKPRNPPPGAAP